MTAPLGSGARPGRALLVIVSGPTGVGKTTVCERLYALPGFARSVSVTTRAPRKGEVQGRDYEFYTRPAFEHARDAGLFLEWAHVHGADYYGTPRGPIEAHLEAGRDVVLNIDVQGAEQVRRSSIPSVSFFLLPPSIDELRARLRLRGDDPAVVERRLVTAERELSRQDEYDHRITNDDLDRTLRSLLGLLEGARGTKFPTS